MKVYTSNSKLAFYSAKHITVDSNKLRQGFRLKSLGVAKRSKSRLLEKATRRSLFANARFFLLLSNISSAQSHYPRCAAYEPRRDFRQKSSGVPERQRQQRAHLCATTAKYLRILRKCTDFEKSKMRIIGTHSSHLCCLTKPTAHHIHKISKDTTKQSWILQLQSSRKAPNVDFSVLAQGKILRCFY